MTQLMKLVLPNKRNTVIAADVENDCWEKEMVFTFYFVVADPAKLCLKRDIKKGGGKSQFQFLKILCILLH